MRTATRLFSYCQKSDNAMKLDELLENKLNEAFDTKPQDFEIVKKRPDSVTYEFSMPDNSLVRVDFDEDRGLVDDETDHFEISFYRSNASGKSFKYDLTNQGGAPLVLATVMATAKDFINQRPDVEYLSFSGDKSEESRIRLYARMIKSLAKKFGFSEVKIDQSKYHMKQVFLLKRDGVDH